MFTQRRESGAGSLKVLIIGPTGETRGAMRGVLGEVLEPEIVVEEIASDQPLARGSADADVVMMLLDSGNPPSFEPLQRLAQAEAGPKVLAVLQDGSPEIIRGALRAGAHEVLFLPLNRLDLSRALLKIDETRRGVLRQGMGLIFSLVSASGGVGVTTLTANLALALQVRTGKRVGVVDLDLQAGDLSTALNLEPVKTIMDLADVKQKLDSIRLESVLTKGPAGVYLLAAPKRVEESELVSSGLVVPVLDVMRQLFDVVLIDCGRYMSENTAAAWERSDQLLYVIDQSLSALRRTWRVLELLKRLGLNHIAPRFVVNRYSGRELISEAQIAQTLARPIFAKIPRDDRSLKAILIQGRDLFKAAPKSALAKSVELLACKLVGDRPEKQSLRRAGFLKMLFSPQRAGATG